MKFIPVLILLLVFFQGCISPAVKTGDPSRYELPGLANTIIFYLNLSSVQVIYNVIDRTSVDYRIEDSIQTFRYPVAVDYSGKNVSMNVSIISIKARNYAHFNFSSNFSGFVAFTLPGGQDFTFIPVDNSTIRVVLPENFTSGTIFLGYVQPKPDNITKDSSGREVLVWNKVQNKKIRVRYHQNDTPVMLMYLFGSLLVCALIVWGYYHYSIYTLKKKREMLEKFPRK